MNTLDWLIVLFLIYSVVRAAIRGLIRELFSLAGLILGFLLACWYYQSAAVYLRGLINSPPLAEFCAFLLIIAAAMAVAALLAAILRRAAAAVGLGFFDRLFGALFGLVRGAILAAAILLAVTAFLPTAPWIENSHLAPYLLHGAHAVSFVMPHELKLQLGNSLRGLDHLKHTAPGWIN